MQELTCSDPPALHRWADYDARCFLVKPRVPAPDLARLLSYRLPGQFWPGSRAITWRCGRKSTWLLTEAALPDLSSCRGIAARLGVEDPPWTLGGICRALLKLLGAEHRPSFHMREELLAPGWHFHLCRPGTYQGATMYDIQAAYHTILTKMPAPFPHWNDRETFWGTFRDHRQERLWMAILEALGEEKLLRNTFTGTMAGSSKRVPFWCKGEKKYVKAQFGPLRPAAWLTVRSVYELCSIAAKQTNAVYANTDCVITTGEAPEVWERAGLRHTCKAQGLADVFAVGIYRVGEKQTLSYGAGGRVPHAPQPDPQRWFAREWLEV